MASVLITNTFSGQTRKLDAPAYDLTDFSVDFFEQYRRKAVEAGGTDVLDESGSVIGFVEVFQLQKAGYDADDNASGLILDQICGPSQLYAPAQQTAWW